MPLSRERGSVSGKGRTCGGGGDSRKSGAEKSLDEAGMEDLERKAVASLLADDLVRRCVEDADTGAGVGTIDKIPLLSARRATYGVAGPCCLLSGG